MSDKQPGRIGSVGEFLAHAYALECESAERYEELADSMETHHNLEVAALFHRLAEFGEEHAAEVRRRAEGVELPRIPPWEYQWSCPEGPETSCTDEIHYLMTAAKALAIALLNELRGRDFYARVALESDDEQVRGIAAEMAEEEEGHVALLREWMERVPLDEERPPEDLDPPNTPE